LILGDHPDGVPVLDEPRALGLALREPAHDGNPHQADELLEVGDELVVEEEGILLEQFLVVVGLLIIQLPHLDQPLDFLRGLRAFLLRRVAVEDEDGADALFHQVDAEVEDANEVGDRVSMLVVEDLVLGIPNLVDIPKQEVAAIHYQLLPRQSGEAADVRDEQRR